jgi:hypothetical protein
VSAALAEMYPHSFPLRPSRWFTDDKHGKFHNPRSWVTVNVQGIIPVWNKSASACNRSYTLRSSSFLVCVSSGSLLQLSTQHTFTAPRPFTCFMHGGASFHSRIRVRTSFGDKHPERWVDRSGQISWLAISIDFIQFRVGLWRRLKSTVSATALTELHKSVKYDVS